MFTAGKKRRQRENRDRAEGKEANLPPVDPSKPQTIEETPLVFIHGLYGSTLVDASSKRKHFLTVGQVLGLRCPSLQLPFDWDDDSDTQSRDNLVPGNPIYSVAKSDAYGPFIEWAQEQDRPFYAFAYDWRRSGNEAAKELHAYLSVSLVIPCPPDEYQKIHERTGRKIQVLGHSNGGCVTMAMLNQYAPTFIHSVVFAGSPFDTGTTLLGDMHFGHTFLKSKRALKPSVTSSFASFYSYLPTDPAKSSFYSATGEELSVDWFSADTWRDRQLAAFRPSAGLSSEEKENFYNFLRKALPDAKRFQMSAHNLKTGAVYPPMAVIAGNSRDTAVGIVENERTGISIPHHLEKGDGTVLFGSTAPSGSVCEKFVSPLSHGLILNEVSVADQALTSLFSARRLTLSL